MKAFTSKGIFIGLIASMLCACSADNSSQAVSTDSAKTVQDTLKQEAPIVAEQVLTSKKEETPVSKDIQKEKNTTSGAKNTVRNYTEQELMNRLREWEKNLKTFQADFDQVSSYDGVEINRSKGRLYYDFTLGFLRWEVLTKENEIDQVGISNKKEIVILDETLKPVTTLSWTQWQQGQANKAIFDIGNYAQLADQHEIKLIQQDAQKAQLAFIPKNGKENYTLLVTLSKKDFFPQNIAVKADDMLTTNELFNVRKNESFPTEIFGGFFK